MHPRTSVPRRRRREFALSLRSTPSNQITRHPLARRARAQFRYTQRWPPPCGYSIVCAGARQIVTLTGLPPLTPPRWGQPTRTAAVLVRHAPPRHRGTDRKSTRLNSSHGYISYAVFCLKKKKKKKKTNN